MTLTKALALTVSGVALFTAAVVTFAETTIYLEDGTVVYTDDPVYSSSVPLYAHEELSDGVLKFTPATPLVGGDVAEDVPEDVTEEELQCWPWAGVGAPEGYSTEACLVEEEPVEECTPGGLTFGGGC